MKKIIRITSFLILFAGLQDARASAQSLFIREGLTTEDTLPEYEFRFMGTKEVAVGNGAKDFGTVSEYVADLDWGLVYLQDVLGGNVDLRLRSALTLLDDGGKKLDLPGQVAYVTADTGWVLGNTEDVSFELRAAPGIYSDLEEFSTEALGIPFSMAFHKMIDPELAAILGLQVRPGFLDPIMPIAGVIWDPAEPVRLAFCLPESRATWQPSGSFRTYVGFEWENTTYDLSGDNEEMTMDDFLLSAGLAVDVGLDAGLEFEIGKMMNRTIDFGDAGSSGADQLDLDSATYLRLGLFGPL
jgi:hypothetical protein